MDLTLLSLSIETFELEFEFSLSLSCFHTFSFFLLVFVTSFFNFFPLLSISSLVYYFHQSLMTLKIQTMHPNVHSNNSSTTAIQTKQNNLIQGKEFFDSIQSLIILDC